MMATTHAAADAYLQRLTRAARVLPGHEGDELVAEIREHIAAALPVGASEAGVRTVLDALGAPEDIVAAARQPHPPRRRGAREIAALVLLVSGFPPILGWLVGVVLLLLSPLWTGRQKVLGILVWPGGLMGSAGLLGVVIVVPTSQRTCAVPAKGLTDAVTTCTTTTGTSGATIVLLIVALVVAVVAPLVVAVHLYRAAGRASDPPL
jgi:uncharacterized membrane protein